MTPLGANATATGGGLPDPSLCPSPVAAPLSGQATRLLAILRMASAGKPVTQLTAGQQLGITGTDDTIRRRVQHLRDEIRDGGQLVCSAWGRPAGMWLPESEREADEYIVRVLSRAYTTIAGFKGLERERRERIVEEVQGLLALDDSAETENNRARFAQKPIGQCKQCGDSLIRWRRDRAFCSYVCRMVWHGRKSA